MSVIQNLQLTPVSAFQNHNYQVPSYQREYVWEDTVSRVGEAN